MLPRHRDLLRLLVLLFVVRAVVLIATPLPGPLDMLCAFPRSARVILTRSAVTGRLSPCPLEPAHCQVAHQLTTAAAGTRRGRRAPSTRTRGSKGALHREAHQRPAPGAALIIGILNVQSLKPKLLELADCNKSHYLLKPETRSVIQIKARKALSYRAEFRS